MKILITAFGPFLDNGMNPTEQVLKQLPDSFEHHSIKTVVLPVVYRHCFGDLQPVIQTYQPDVILCLGLAAGSTTIRLERIAVNRMDSTSPDNNGTILQDTPIDITGENALFTRLPIRELEQHLLKRNTSLSI